MITPKQKRMIVFIEKYTNHVFNGESFEQAWDFIHAYMDEARKEKEKPTEAQKRLARLLCKLKKTTVTLHTRKDYMEFISENIDMEEYYKHKNWM